jgi:hypothetical protein
LVDGVEKVVDWRAVLPMGSVVERYGTLGFPPLRRAMRQTVPFDALAVTR